MFIVTMVNYSAHMEILFQRIDKMVIEIETEKLKSIL